MPTQDDALQFCRLALPHSRLCVALAVCALVYLAQRVFSVNICFSCWFAGCHSISWQKPMCWIEIILTAVPAPQLMLCCDKGSACLQADVSYITLIQAGGVLWVQARLLSPLSALPVLSRTFFVLQIRTQKIMSPSFPAGECSLRLCLYQSVISGEPGMCSEVA